MMMMRMKVTKMPKMTKMTKMPKMTKMTKITKMTKMPKMPKMPKMTKMTKMPKMPQMPKMTKMTKKTKMIMTECDEYIRIFEYSNILVTNIYSDIRSYQFFFYEYIRTFVRVKFVCTNILGHSFVSNLFVRIYSDIRW